MVTETEPAVEEGVLAPAEEETENPTPEVEVAAPEGEEAAPEAVSLPEPTPQEPDRLATLQEQLESLQKQIAENERRQRQSRNAKDAEERNRARLQKETAELEDSVAAALIRAGYPDPDSKTIATVIERGFDKRADQHFARLQEDADTALDSLLFPNRVSEDELSDRQRELVGRISKKMGEWFPAARQMIEDEARKDYVPKSELPKLIEAEIERRNAKAREGKTELKRVDGTAIAAGDELAWWNGLTPEGRRDPANIARFDRYTSSLRR